MRAFSFTLRANLTRLGSTDHITSESANFETVLSLLSSFFVPEDEDAVLHWIEKVLGDKKIRSDMARWRQDWGRLVASGESHSALL